jgi:hypothetical protein
MHPICWLAGIVTSFPFSYEACDGYEACACETSTKCIRLAVKLKKEAYRMI